MKKKIIFLVLAFFYVSLFADDGILIKHLQDGVKSGEIFSLVETLASPEYEGRLTGTEGYNKAVQMAADFFKKYGLLPITGNDTYTQPFPLSYTKVNKSKLTLYFEDGKGEKQVVKCEHFKDSYPLGFSGSGDVSGDVVFAGYGITAPEFGCDDYKDLDVKGKIVLIIKGAPKAKEGEDWQKYDNHRFRTRNAKEHGAAALLYIYGAKGNPNGNYLEGFPMISIKEELADRMFQKSGNTTKALRKQLDERKNVSFAMNARAEVFVKSENFKGTGYNVTAYIQGTDEKLRDEFIVLGAHLDHCGMWPELKPGADDNASGSAVLLTIAKTLATCPVKPKRSILFILFGGEEMGLLGSDYFVSHIPEKVKKINFVMNMDMVGAGFNVFILRLKNYRDFENIVTAAPKTLGLACKITGNKVTGRRRAGADHAPFVLKGIPAVSVFSAGGNHHGYHTNEDTIYWITPKIMEDIAKILSFTAMKMAQ